jgi:hypothetical protein
MSEKIDLDSVLLPCENSQPPRISVDSEQISRFPPLVDEQGINPKFQQFFDTIVACFLEDKLESLYEISDKSVSEQHFYQLGILKWKPHLMEYAKASSRGMDVELNMDRFQQLHRNIIGGFNVITYHINEKNNEFGDGILTEFKQCSTEILFTYKNGDFKIIPVFSSFLDVERS